MGEYLTYLKKFYLALFIIIVAIVAIGLLITHTIPEFKKISNIQIDYKSKTSSLADAERRLADLNATLEQEKKQDLEIVKAFFIPVSDNEDNEGAISQEFEEILKLLRDNKIKTRTLKFEPEPKDDNFVKHVSNKYYVSKMSADMIATYTDFENFLRDLYKHEHFLEISRIEIKPYNKDKKILLINLQLKLYAQKGGVPKPAPIKNPTPVNNPTTASDSAPKNNPAPVEQNAKDNSQSKVQKSQKPKKHTQSDLDNQQGVDEMSKKHKIYDDRTKK